jgi:hypothetical protein
MRVIYIWATVAVVAILVAMAYVIIDRSQDLPPEARRMTTGAVMGSVQDCDTLSGIEKERCLERVKGAEAGAAAEAPAGSGPASGAEGPRAP